MKPERWRGKIILNQGNNYEDGDVILAVMNTTLAVVKVKPENI